MGWVCLSISQGAPKITGSHQKLRRWKKVFLPRAFRGSMAPWTPRFWTSSLQNCERINVCGLKPPSLGHFVTVALGS